MPRNKQRQSPRKSRLNSLYAHLPTYVYSFCSKQKKQNRLECQVQKDSLSSAPKRWGDCTSRHCYSPPRPLSLFTLLPSLFSLLSSPIIRLDHFFTTGQPTISPLPLPFRHFHPILPFSPPFIIVFSQPLPFRRSSLSRLPCTTPSPRIRGHNNCVLNRHHRSQVPRIIILHLFVASFITPYHCFVMTLFLLDHPTFSVLLPTTSIRTVLALDVTPLGDCLLTFFAVIFYNKGHAFQRSILHFLDFASP